MAVEDRIHAVVDPIIEDLSLELVDLVYGGGRLKITIDEEGGLGTEQLTRATRMISHELDLADPVNGTYTLEVTSPGVERPLRTQSHYERSLGEQVALKLVPNDDKIRRIKGELVSANDVGVTVRDDEDDEHVVGYHEIAKAKTVFDWGPAPKPGKAPQKKTPEKKNKSDQTPKNSSESSETMNSSGSAPADQPERAEANER